MDNRASSETAKELVLAIIPAALAMTVSHRDELRRSTIKDVEVLAVDLAKLMAEDSAGVINSAIAAVSDVLDKHKKRVLAEVRATIKDELRVELLMELRSDVAQTAISVRATSPAIGRPPIGLTEEEIMAKLANNTIFKKVEETTKRRQREIAARGDVYDVDDACDDIWTEALLSKGGNDY